MILLTRLGFDTGFKPYYEHYAEEIRAGCEWDLPINLEEETLDEIRERLIKAPRVMKSPEWGLELKVIMERELTEIDHVVIPFRDLDVSARSRLGAGLKWRVPDHLEGDELQEGQAEVLAMALGRAVEACMLYSIPCTMMHFPLLVQDVEYCYTKLKELGNIDYFKFTEEFNLLARPEQIVHG